MAQPDLCPDCGGDRSAGICPRCLIRLGLDGPALSLSHPSGPGATIRLDPDVTGTGVLASIVATVGPLPSVLLRDTDGGDEPPMVRPGSPEVPARVDPSGRLQLLGEIARGGMGAVLKGRDTDLGRDLAVKVLLERHRDRPEMVRRFIEEAQIGGQLQHPGIVPVYELGTFADARPFFSMKLVKGRTFAHLLAGRSDPADDLPQFLSIFAAVAQTMAYAHARGVMHRDLKPSNVMVGSFGEVQVMDWGLAKVLSHGGVVDDAEAGKEPPQETIIATARSGSDNDLSHPGSILGTPSYMAPEQARGETGQLDERCDVFSLGSILCEILTGVPAFKGRSSGEILRKAALGDTADALARLDESGADAELTALAQDCLARERDDRPLDASVVAERVATYLSGVQEKLKTSERERAVAEARAVEERKRRRLQLGLAAAVLALTTTGGLGTTYYLQERSARAAAVAKVLGEASTLRDVALAHPEDVARWQMALAALRQAEGAAAGDPDALRQLGTLLAEVQAGADAAERDRALLDRLVDIRSAKADDHAGDATDAAYAAAFREARLDLSALPPAEAGAKVKARPAAVALAIATALDDWAAVRRDLRKDTDGADRLAAAARVADPDPWRNDLRSALALSDKDRRKAALKALAATANYADLGAVSLDLLGKALIDARELAAAESVLRRAQRRFTGDVWVNYDLALALEELARRDEAIRFYIAARAVRPETAHELAHALAAKGESEEAIEVFRDLIRLRPKEGRHLGCLGSELQAHGRSREAAAVLERALVVARESIRLKPDDANAHNTLGLILHSQRKPAEAVAALREAIRLKPYNNASYSNLGLVLRSQGKLDEAVAACRESIRLKPDDAASYGNLAGPLMDQGKLEEAIAAYREAIRLDPVDAMAYKNLAVALDQMGKHDEAVVACREAIRLRPGYSAAHDSLGSALSGQGKPDEAAAAYREAIRLKPDDAMAHYNLGLVLYAQGKPDAAAAALREAIRLDPDDAMAHYSLGAVLGAQRKFDEAAAACRESIRLKPDDATAHANLGGALLEQGKLDEAVAALREAIRLKPDSVDALFNLGNALQGQKTLDEAIAVYRDAIRLKPDFAAAYTNLGVALAIQGKLDDALAAYRESIRLKPDDAFAHTKVGHALWAQGKFDEAVAAFRESIRLKPEDAASHSNLGALLCDGKSDYPAAEAAFREAIRLKPDNANYYFNLGNALKAQGKFDEAVAAYGEAIRIEPNYAAAHSNLGIVLRVQGKDAAAVAAFREAISLRPDHALAHCELGLALRSRGDYAESLVMLRKGHELGSKQPGWPHPSAQWVAETERMAALARRLPALLKGEDRPKDVAEHLALAQMCHDTKRFAAAARFWAGALEADPKLGDDRRAQHRYNAACDAALAAAGQGKDDPPPDDAARAKIRRQARGYLTAELAAWSTLLEAEPRARPAVLPILQHWKNDADLAGIRDPDALAKLPADEQDAWNALWKDVDALLKKAGGGDRP